MIPILASVQKEQWDRLDVNQLFGSPMEENIRFLKKNAGAR